MGGSVDEIGTRMVPWQQIEVSHARNRPVSERPPLPQPGEQVWYRQFEWNRNPVGDLVEPVLADVVEVQHPHDASDSDFVDGVGWVRDPNLWHLVRDEHGRVQLTPLGALRYEPVADPWPWVRLRLPDSGPVHETREARLRGSAGWLPLDYSHRPERWRLPSQTALLSTRPVLRPLNVPLAAPRPARG